MPREPIFDVSKIDTSKLLANKEDIARVNPHRYEFAQLDGIYFMDSDTNIMAGFRDVREDEFWVRGHIPGRPLFPGALMIETAAQMVSYYAMEQMPDKGFLGFAGVDNVKFRGQITPGEKVILLGKMVELKERRCIGDTQAFLNGKQVFEGRITGMWI